MDKVSDIIAGLEIKIKKLVELHGQLLKENERLKQELSEINNTVIDQKVIINNFEEKVKVLKVVKSLEGGRDTYEVKMKINELVREIDKCIALLNN